MGTVMTANAPQTLYVTIRRDELRQLREERAVLQNKVAQLTSMLQHAQLIGSGTHAALGNNQLLCAEPASGRIRRFLVGPRGCEITGCVLTPDRRTLFVNVQHPSERNDDGSGTPQSAWPDGDVPGSARPRSATVVVQRRDGGIVGT